MRLFTASAARVTSPLAWSVPASSRVWLVLLLLPSATLIAPATAKLAPPLPVTAMAWFWVRLSELRLRMLRSPLAVRLGAPAPLALSWVVTLLAKLLCRLPTPMAKAPSVPTATEMATISALIALLTASSSAFTVLKLAALLPAGGRAKPPLTIVRSPLPPAPATRARLPLIVVLVVLAMVVLMPAPPPLRPSSPPRATATGTAWA